MICKLVKVRSKATGEILPGKFAPFHPLIRSGRLEIVKDEPETAMLDRTAETATAPAQASKARKARNV
jgi:hypothetical protein